MWRKVMAVATCALGVAACAPSYVYQPAEHATATIKGIPAADYEIPANHPQGDVRVASFGMSKIAPREAPSQSQKAVHVRLVVANNSQQPWTIDSRQQLIALPGGRRIAPAWVTTHEGEPAMPTVNVEPGGKRTIDLFYPLPPEMQSAQKVPEFDVIWGVQTPQQVVTERTPFERLRVEPTYAYGYGPGWGWWDGWGGPWWSEYPGVYGGVVAGSPSWGVW